MALLEIRDLRVSFTCGPAGGGRSPAVPGFNTGSSAGIVKDNDPANGRLALAGTSAAECVAAGAPPCKHGPAVLS